MAELLMSCFGHMTRVGLTLTHTHTHTHTTQPFYSSLDFVRDKPGEPVLEETFSHSHLL